MLQWQGRHPTPRLGGQLARHLSGLRHHSCADSASWTLIQENKMPALCLESQSVPRAAGQGPRQAPGQWHWHWLAAPSLGPSRHWRHLRVPTQGKGR